MFHVEHGEFVRTYPQTAGQGSGTVPQVRARLLGANLGGEIPEGWGVSAVICACRADTPVRCR